MFVMLNPRLCPCSAFVYAAIEFSKTVVAIHLSTSTVTLAAPLERSPRDLDQALCYLIFTAAPYSEEET